jgi:hypothetical protein
LPTRLIVQESEGSVQVLLHREGQTLSEPAGPAVPFEPPLSAEEREDLRWYLEDYLEIPYAVYQDRGTAIAGKIPVWGERLFESVFGAGRPGQKPYVQAREAEPCELWIASSSPAFLSLPWELLQDPGRPNPLALELAGINRTVASDAAAADPRPGERLRVLMVIARPYGRQDVRYRMIARPLLERLEPVAGEVLLDVARARMLLPPRYRKSLEIEESLRNRFGMAATYANLGALAEARGEMSGALDWTVHCVALFPDFPHPLAGTGPRHLARLTASLGMRALEESWRRCTGEPLPAAVRAWVEAQGGADLSGGALHPTRPNGPGDRSRMGKACGRARIFGWSRAGLS